MKFPDLRLAEPLLRAVEAEGYVTPTPIQQQAIPHVIEGRDLLAVAQTGTGKTAAFALPVLHRLAPAAPGRGRPIRVLVLAPTRELAAQIADSFGSYGRHLDFRHAVIFGGVGKAAQKAALRQGLDILVATPGRLLDLMGEGLVDFRRLEVLVVDEADRMLDMGFIHDVRKVISALPTQRQTLLFSATMPEAIVSLSQRILRDPARVEVTPQASTAEKVRQHLLLVERPDKKRLLEVLLHKPQVERAIVFTRTKREANKVTEHLVEAGIGAAAIHGNKSQTHRERALGDFRDGAVKVLVATDIAARGIDVDGISHVINYDLPNVAEQYVHRIGRTARAGRAGMALSFCDLEERAYLRDIEKLIRQPIPVVEQHPYKSTHPPGAVARPAPRPPGGGRGPRQGGRGGAGGRGRSRR
ncbi:MAG: DEAD/DEAH box helicase [Alphaproteobacteria bacterium]|nr:DEAD/DEAH box helicase [Alphaproteobacteria bacterium]